MFQEIAFSGLLRWIRINMLIINILCYDTNTSEILLQVQFSSLHCHSEHVTAPEYDWQRNLAHGTSPLSVMAILADEPMHPYAIRQELIRRTKGRLVPTEGTLYPLLAGLEKRGWVASQMIPGRGEQLRRTYRLTSAGRKELQRRTEVWTAFVRNMNGLLQPPSKVARS
jgi:PadR family transcriptional regulator, regulatory protein PadR